MTAFAGAVLLSALALASAQFGPGVLPPSTCAGTLTCAAGSLCPEAFPDPAGNLQQTVATRLRDFSIEGRITAIDTLSKVIVVNGLAFDTSLVPGGVLDVGKLASDTPTTISQLTASDLGSTMIVNGVATKLPSGCVQMQANTITFQVTENVVVGQLTGVDLVNKRFFINGAPVAINTNPRLPRYLNNIEGKVINVIGGVPTTTPTAAALTNEIAPLANVIGTFVAAVGHYDVVNKVLLSEITDSEVPAPIPVGGLGFSVTKYIFSKGKLRLDFDLACSTEAQCNNAVIRAHLGTTTTNACAQPVCNLAGCTQPRPSLATFVGGQWTIPYSIRLTIAAAPPSFCVDDATSGASRLVTGP